MACFLVPAAEAVVSTAATIVTEKREQKKMDVETEEKQEVVSEQGTSLSQELKWLDAMLWGGSILLLLEHIWHGEVTLFFPFFTAATTPGGLAVLLTEMTTVGVAMAVVVTIFWMGMVAWTTVKERRQQKNRARKTVQS